MKTESLFKATATATISAMQITDDVLPVMETSSADPWQCIPANLTQYLDVPKPTGALLTAIYDRGKELRKTCTYTGLQDSLCTPPGKSDWCGISTAAPPAAVSDLSAYGSQAAAWWGAHSASIKKYKEECPQGWQKMGTPAGHTWLNITNFVGECYVEAHLTGTLGSQKPRTVTENTVAGSAPTVNVAKQTSTGKTSWASKSKRADVLDGWMVVASTGLAAAMSLG